MSDELTHLDEQGRARMVDVAQKEPTSRVAIARATLRLEADTIAKLRKGSVSKGDVFAVARVAGIQAAKKTWELIPLCHQVALTSCEVKFEIDKDGQRVHVQVLARCTDRTGVEMEALTGASVAALTIYDMVKSIDREATIESLQLTEKKGGRSGDWSRD